MRPEEVLANCDTLVQSESESERAHGALLLFLFGEPNRALGADESIRARVHAWAGKVLELLPEDDDASGYAVRGIAARVAGELGQAVTSFEDGVARAKLRGQERDGVDLSLLLADALLDRAGPADASSAASVAAGARALIESSGAGEFTPWLRFVTLRARAAAGDAEGALGELEPLIVELRQMRNVELEWRAVAFASSLHTERGSKLIAHRHDLAAIEVLESIAMGLPRDLRGSFWRCPRRASLRKRASAVTERGRASPMTLKLAGLETRAQRLLDIIKRLASEHDLDRLLDRITDSAVELSGAERGFVLLVDPNGQLEPKTVRGSRADHPETAFSRSIAEAVLIDGEPIITVDARDDALLSEYLSVHKLMLKSVACMPIRGRAGTVGVLYLEHRARRARFSEEDLDLLFAFADQAAIALENARLVSELAQRKDALEVANRDLEEAKREIERVLVARTAELQETQSELAATRQQLRGAYDRHGIIGRSEPMRRVFAVIDRIKESNIPVVIFGESGTGKELVARAIHFGGARKKKPFVALNCGAIPEALLESELFGHVRGAFTGADRDRRGVLSRASSGTLFLDEIGDMPAKMQVDLLRVLQEKKVRPIGGEVDEDIDVRIISASNKSLKELVTQGVFREDLFYRLHVVEVRLPPLRERADDIPALCDHFLKQIAEREGREVKRVSREALAVLMQHALPGNVRQLEHLLLNATVMVESDVIEAEDLALGGLTAVDSAMASRVAATVAEVPVGEAPAQSFEDFKTDEKQRILQALEQNGWNRAKAARALGIPRRTFYRRLKEHGILQ